MKYTIKIITIIILIIISFAVNGQWAYNKGYNKGNNTRIISFSAEKENCKVWGGELYLAVRWNNYPLSDKENWAKMKCVKSYTQDNKEITETLFNYNL